MPISVAVVENIPPILATASAVTTAFAEFTTMARESESSDTVDSRRMGITQTCNSIAHLQPVDSECSCEVLYPLPQLAVGDVRNHLVLVGFDDGNAIVPSSKKVLSIVHTRPWEPERDFGKAAWFEYSFLQSR